MTQSGTTEVTSQLPPLSDAAMFLVGAGASFDGGLPLSRDITRLALGELGSHRVQAEIATALRYVCGALIKFDTDRGGSPTDLPDIERLVSAVELLSKRNGLEVSPFIGSWDPLSISWATQLFRRTSIATSRRKSSAVEDT